MFSGESKLGLAVLRCFADVSDRNRELAVEIVTEVVERAETVETLIPLLVPTFKMRLLSTSNNPHELVETTEEVRLAVVELCRKVMDKPGFDIRVCVDDILPIFARLLMDPFADVRKVACACVVSAVYPPAQAGTEPKTPVEFMNLQGEMVADQLKDSLFTSLKHPHASVRVATLQALEAVVCCGKAAEKILKDEQFSWHVLVADSQPMVRMEVVRVFGHWSATLWDRYSFFDVTLAPLLVLRWDGVPTIGEQAKRMMQKLGELYYAENDNDEQLKMEADFAQDLEAISPSLQMEHQARYGPRPSLGERALVHRITHRSFAPCFKDLSHWTLHMRWQAQLLLRSLLLWGEGAILSEMGPLLSAMSKCWDEEEKALKAIMEENLRIVGALLRREEDVDLILIVGMSLLGQSPLPEFQERSSHSGASQSSSLPPLSGAQVPTRLKCHIMEAMGQLLSGVSSEGKAQLLPKLVRWRDEACGLWDVEEWEGTLVLLQACLHSPQLQQDILLETLPGWMAWLMSGSYPLRPEALRMLEGLAQAADNVRNLSGFLEHALPPLLTAWTSALLAASDVWLSPAYYPFLNALQLCHPAAVSPAHFPSTLDVLSRLIVCTPPAKGMPLAEAALEAQRLALTLLLTLLQHPPVVTPTPPELLLRMEQLYRDVLVPSMVWKVGKPASFQRRMCALSLGAILTSGYLTVTNAVASSTVTAELWQAICSAIEDDDTQTRRALVHFSGQILRVWKDDDDQREKVELERLRVWALALVKRLDDADDGIRQDVCEPLGHVLRLLSQRNADTAVCEHLLAALFLHLDDNEEKMRMSARNALQSCYEHVEASIREAQMRIAMENNKRKDLLQELGKLVLS